jgi:hypothetical protein
MNFHCEILQRSDEEYVQQKFKLLERRLAAYSSRMRPEEFRTLNSRSAWHYSERDWRAAFTFGQAFPLWFQLESIAGTGLGGSIATGIGTSDPSNGDDRRVCYL